MAIIIRGKTKCPLCGQLIKDGQDAVGFPSFVGNKLDPLWLFNDESLHAECLHKHPLAAKALARCNEAIKRTGPGNRACVVCKKEIRDPDEYFTLGHLTDEELAPLYRYNYIQAHFSCLPKWRELASVITLIRDLKESGTWKGDVLDDLLIELEKAISRESTS